WGCLFWPVSNWFSGNQAARWLNEKLLKIDRRRVPPSFARTGFGKWHLVNYELGERLWTAVKEVQPRVLLFPDTFVNYFEPWVGLEAIGLLDRMGERVLPAVPGPFGERALDCCGRPLISNGLLSQAVENARSNVEHLYPWATEGRPIIACEPSCILTIKDDYPALLQGEMRHKAEVVA